MHMLSPYHLVHWSIFTQMKESWCQFCLRVSHHSITWVTSIPLSFRYSMDLSLNAATAQESWEWNIFKTRGLHFIYLNTHSLLPKIEEFWIKAKPTNAAILSISKSKLDDSALEPEIKTDNFKILQCNWNRHRKGVASYKRNDLSYNIISVFPFEMESVFFEILLPNCKPVTVWKIYRPPIQSNFLEDFKFFLWKHEWNWFNE